MFFRKGSDRKDIEEIKNAVSDDIDDAGELFIEKPAAREPVVSAPLFVKVEKYRETLEHLHEIKMFISGVRQLFGVLQEIENIRNDALKIFKATVQRLEKSVIEMD